MRTAAALVILVLACAACKTAQPQAQQDQKPSTYDGEGKPKIKFEEAPAQTGGRPGPGAVDYVMTPFENIVYLPWKLIGGAGKGAADGVSAGFAKDRMPIMGLLFSPLNAAAGLVTGAVEGVSLSPVVVGPSDDFSRAMGQPLRHPTSIWWYE
jgi:hypothetical protein